MLTDETLVKWARGEKADGLDDRDIALATDVYSLQPILFYMARFAIVHNESSPLYVEIGTADGSTALPLAKAAAEANGHLHSIDPSSGGTERCHQLIDHFGYRDRWTHHLMKSNEFFEKHPDIRIDFAFIDGDHAWDGVRDDILHCWRALWPGGTIFVSDYDPIYEGHPRFQEETRYDEKCAKGIAKGLILAAPELRAGRAQIAGIHLHPNPSFIIRKPFIGEIGAP